jgi:galactokinase
MIEEIKTKFIELFQSQPLLIRAPGRINLIGEHTDYNEGFVLPAAIDKEAVFAIQFNELNTFRFYAFDIEQYFETGHIQPAPGKFHWVNYLMGVLAQFKKQGTQLKGIDCVFGSNIPIGAGLSSSAAIECGFAIGLNSMLQTGFSDFKLVQMAQKAEHEFAGVLCGIMDQYASVFGKKNHVIKLDCRSNTHQYFPIEINNVVITLADTKVKHDLASSAYNQRRLECESGVNFLKDKGHKINALRDVSEELIKSYKYKLDPAVYKRCHYIISENQRVQDACNALEKNDFNKFGILMYNSHEGLKNDYEVSCKVLDLLVDLTRKMDFVYGSRMMGGGFGGCTINLIRQGEELQFKDIITKEYLNKTGITPDIYFVNISDGGNILRK